MRTTVLATLPERRYSEGPCVPVPENYIIYIYVYGSLVKVRIANEFLGSLERGDRT